jgi:hypothetical protein
MKRQILFLLLGVLGISTSKLYAQESAKKNNYDVKKNVTCRITPSPEGCSISFTYQKIEYDAKSPRDAASGQASGKRQHKPIRFVVSSVDNSISEIKSPRDVATGQSSGKVSYSDLSVMISLERASVGKFQPQKLMVDNGEFDLPDLPDGNYDLIMSWSWGATNSGAGSGGTGMGQGRASFTVTVEDGVVSMAIKEQGMPAKKK